MSIEDAFGVSPYIHEKCRDFLRLKFLVGSGRSLQLCMLNVNSKYKQGCLYSVVFLTNFEVSARSGYLHLCALRNIEPRIYINGSSGIKNIMRNGQNNERLESAFAKGNSKHRFTTEINRGSALLVHR